MRLLGANQPAAPVWLHLWWMTHPQSLRWGRKVSQELFLYPWNSSNAFSTKPWKPWNETYHLSCCVSFDQQLHPCSCPFPLHPSQRGVRPPRGDIPLRRKPRPMSNSFCRPPNRTPSLWWVRHLLRPAYPQWRKCEIKMMLKLKKRGRLRNIPCGFIIFKRFIRAFTNNKWRSSITAYCCWLSEGSVAWQSFNPAPTTDPVQ